MRRAGLVEQHVIGDDGRHAGAGASVRQIMQAELVVGRRRKRQRHIGAVAEDVAQPPQPQGASVVGLVGDEDGDQPFAIGDQIRPFEMALALAGSPLPSDSRRQSRDQAGRSVG
jgi:hypothetical protein